MPTILGREPVRIVAVTMAVIAVIATYGLNLVPDPDKFQTALLGVLTLLASGEVSRRQVTPTAAPVLPLNTPVTTPKGDAAVVSGAAPSSRAK